MAMKLAVYTAAYGMAWPPEPEVRREDVTYQCAADSPVRSSGWHWLVDTDKGGNNTLKARRIKLATRFWHDATLWIDSRFTLLVDPLEFAESLPPEVEVAAFPHPDRHTIIQEAEAIISCGKAPADAINRQLAHYLRLGHGEDMEHLTTTGFLFRRNTPNVRYMNELWWADVRRWSLRDQMSVDYAAKVAGVRIHYLDGHYRDNAYAEWSKTQPTV